ncbi:MAG: MoaD/ThiS family protein [Thermoleophilia bacterium]
MEAEEKASIEVTLHLHPHLTRYSPRIGASGPQPVEVPEGTTAGELLTGICGLPGRLQLFIALNGRQASPDEPLRDGDRVRVFMPLSGG